MCSMGSLRMAPKVSTNYNAEDMHYAPVAVPPKVWRLVAGCPRLATAHAIAENTCRINSVWRSIAVESFVVALVEKEARDVAGVSVFARLELLERRPDMGHIVEVARAVEGEVGSRGAVPFLLHKVDHFQDAQVVCGFVPPEVNIRVWQELLAILLRHLFAGDDDATLGVCLAHAVALALLHLDKVRRLCLTRQAQDEVTFPLTYLGDDFPPHGWHEKVGKYKWSTLGADR